MVWLVLGARDLPVVVRFIELVLQIADTTCAFIVFATIFFNQLVEFASLYLFYVALFLTIPMWLVGGRNSIRLLRLLLWRLPLELGLLLLNHNRLQSFYRWLFGAKRRSIRLSYSHNLTSLRIFI